MEFLVGGITNKFELNDKSFLHLNFLKVNILVGTALHDGRESGWLCGMVWKTSTNLPRNISPTSLWCYHRISHHSFGKLSQKCPLKMQMYYPKSLHINPLLPIIILTGTRLLSMYVRQFRMRLKELGFRNKGSWKEKDTDCRRVMGQQIFPCKGREAQMHITRQERDGTSLPLQNFPVSGSIFPN